MKDYHRKKATDRITRRDHLGPLKKIPGEWREPLKKNSRDHPRKRKMRENPGEKALERESERGNCGEKKQEREL